MNQAWQDNVYFVLNQPTQAGNIGSCARALKTMGFSNLRLVQPCRYKNAMGRKMAMHAQDVLYQAEVFTTLPQAIADCHYVVAATARTRTHPLPDYEASQLAPFLKEQAQQKKVGILFGTESAGLSNEDVQLAYATCHIAGNADYNVLNLAQAVQIFAYIFFIADTNTINSETLLGEVENLPTHAQREAMIDALRHLLVQIEYLSPNVPAKLEGKFRKLISRIHLNTVETHMFHGALATLSKALTNSQQQTTRFVLKEDTE